MSKKEKNPPCINWFGGVLVTRNLLIWTKGAKDDVDDDSFIEKMNKQNFIVRVQSVLMGLHSHGGPTLEAAQSIQNNKFFTDVSAEALAKELSDSIDILKKGGIFKFNVAEFGDLAFSPPSCDCEENEEEDE